MATIRCDEVAAVTLTTTTTRSANFGGIGVVSITGPSASLWYGTSRVGLPADELPGLRAAIDALLAEAGE